MTEKKAVDELNDIDYKELFESERRLNRKLIRSIIRATPRTIIIPILKELKIIEVDWEKRSNTHKERDCTK